MRHWRALVPGLLALLPVACAGGPGGQPVSRWDAARPPTSPSAELVQLDVALLECPLQEEYLALLNHTLWRYTDEQAIALEDRAALEDNGFRAGLVIGLPPTELRTLLKSERCCANPRRRLLVPGRPSPLLLGPNRPECRFQLRQPEGTRAVELQQAQFALLVTPTLTPDGRTRLRFTPRVEHGEYLRELQVAPDRSGFTLEVKRQMETYSDLSWEVALGPNEYLVIGTWFDPNDTLGYQAFVEGGGFAPVQRLLVIRSGRSGGGIDAEIAELPPADPNLTERPPALALQATWSAVRGCGP
jgi:hypothetical protein